MTKKKKKKSLVYKKKISLSNKVKFILLIQSECNLNINSKSI